MQDGLEFARSNIIENCIKNSHQPEPYVVESKDPCEYSKMLHATCYSFLRLKSDFQDVDQLEECLSPPAMALPTESNKQILSVQIKMVATNLPQ